MKSNNITNDKHDLENIIDFLVNVQNEKKIITKPVLLDFEKFF
jgi:hypothetical protein